MGGQPVFERVGLGLAPITLTLEVIFGMTWSPEMRIFNPLAVQAGVLGAVPGALPPLASAGHQSAGWRRRPAADTPCGMGLM